MPRILLVPTRGPANGPFRRLGVSNRTQAAMLATTWLTEAPAPAAEPPRRHPAQPS